MRVDDWKRRLNGEDAALKLRYGEFRWCVFREELTKKILAALLAARFTFGNSPLDSSRDATGLGWEKVVNIDHSCGNTRVSSKSVSKFPLRGAGFLLRGASLDVSHLFGLFLEGCTVSQWL
jgi:hypothetical protein